MSCLRAQFLIKSGYSPQHVLCWTERQQNCHWVGNPQTTALRLTPPSSALPPFGCFLERGWINLDIRILTWIIRVRCSFGKPSPWHMSTKQIKNHLGKLCLTTQSSVCEWVVIRSVSAFTSFHLCSLLVVGNTSGCMKIKGPGMGLPSMVPVKVAPKPLSAQLSSTSFNVVRYKSREKSNYFLPSQNLQRRVWVAGLCLGNFGSPSNLFHTNKSESPFREPFTNKKQNELSRGWSTGQKIVPWCHEGLLDRFCIFPLPLAMDKGSRIRGRKTMFPTAMGGQVKSWAWYITIPEYIGFFKYSRMVVPVSGNPCGIYTRSLH